MVMASSRTRCEFRLVKSAQKFSAEYYLATADCPKAYRQTLVREVGECTLNLITYIRIANELPVQSKERTDNQTIAKRLIDKIKDYIPVLRLCRCMCLAKEAELMKSLGNLEIGFDYWVKSDKNR